MKAALIVLTVAAAVSGAVTILPILGYSSSTGFLIGGYMIQGFETIPPGSSFSLDAYYGTAGVIKFQPSFTRVFHGGVLNTYLECRKLLEKKWFGWGNQTSPDSSALMDLEMNRLSGNYTFPLSSRVFITTGVEARHSSVFNREESILWDRMPGQVFDATLTAGLNGGITAVFPGPVKGDILLEAGGFFQTGDVSYSGLSGRARIQARPWSGGQLALGSRLNRHFGIQSTPIPYTSGIGANVDFRGFSDHRFTGPVWAIAQFEVSQLVVEFKNEENEPALSLTLAAFTEAGRVAGSFGEMTMKNIHTDIGGGIRIGAGGEATMRMDAAWGDEGMVLSTGFQSAL